MSKSKSSFAIVAAIVGMFAFAQMAVAQDCGCQTTAAFGYPSGGCGGGCLGGGGIGGQLGGGKVAACKQEFRARLEHAQQISAKVSARNAAWPKPFACADAQLYSQYWNPMINAGFEDQCLLTSIHFDQETGELTSYGKQQIAGVMRNMPSHRKVVYIQQAESQQVTQARYSKVAEVVQTWYGSAGRVAYSNRPQIMGVGSRAEYITNLARENAPVPIIPIASGSEGVSQSVSN